MIEQEDRDQQKISEEFDDRMTGADVALMLVGLALLDVGLLALLWLLPW